ncbi:bifunctional hydroxymethylpyrimidine kinase/phosphomethylpyrimidine kinase [Leuconostocaceae bacterium ESL0723]|nr:bifunctional hydroxymethylpyrimidine kinase/phosphomethylpyrimidine kinase [Leuconostocaceae bacterium ESL0723]
MTEFTEVLTVAGTDSGGGAGMMADIKTFQQWRVFSTAVVTGVTAQNTLGVQDIFPLPSEMIDAQFASIRADFKIKAVKTGALFDRKRVQAVVKNLKVGGLGPLVVDPVMVAKGGAHLLTEDAIQTVIAELLPLATVVTPNLPEAEVVVGHPLKTQAEIAQAAKTIQAMGPQNVVIKGGHQDGDHNQDYLLLADQSVHILDGQHVESPRKHGTGDTFSSVITAHLAQGKSVLAAVQAAKAYLNTILTRPIQVGQGHGPLNHWGGGPDV